MLVYSHARGGRRVFPLFPISGANALLAADGVFGNHSHQEGAVRGAKLGLLDSTGGNQQLLAEEGILREKLPLGACEVGEEPLATPQVIRYREWRIEYWRGTGRGSSELGARGAWKAR